MGEGGKLNNLISLEFNHYVTGKWCCEVVLYDSDSMWGLLTQRTCVCHQSVPRCQQQQQLCATTAAITLHCCFVFSCEACWNSLTSKM
jgi:hypothetical protein